MATIQTVYLQKCMKMCLLSGERTRASFWSQMQHRCVYLSKLCSDNCSWFKQPYFNSNKPENMLLLFGPCLSEPRVAGQLLELVRAVRGLLSYKAWIIDAVYECMFSIWPLGLQWNSSRPLKGLKEKRDCGSVRDRWSLSMKAMGHLVPGDPPSAISDMFNQDF